MPRQLKLPGTYAGGKRRAAPIIWRLLGDPDYYVEPFCGWASVFYGRPAPPATRTSARFEIIGDADGVITNLHRAVKYDPDGMIRLAAWPTSDLDMKARRPYIWDRRDWLRDLLLADPHRYDLEIAAWTLWVSIVCIGGATNMATHRYGGIMRSRHAPCTDSLAPILRDCAARLATTHIYAGDWTVLAGAAPLVGRPDHRYGTTFAIYLDPPYETALRKEYHQGNDVAPEVRAWCRDTMAPYVRAVLSGYDDEHDELLDHGWTKHQGLANRGTGKNGTEQLWASPACLDPDSPPDALHLETP